ncbi:hypothetical protein Cs7R123_32260 [Catellatospora sp. TT07R-123]|uniref:hypothetical protein n=1 Tax=Catellatospora sp. TT07R-123 TaxID=2733863 RepID=UPI001B1391C6|nr:hypothetical protein [Catellatospora sp. TT07R-123]GHJ45884.1 hypothetical protein Cs7R123_32260 [Catellatospora sp. TT07R-123]
MGKRFSGQSVRAAAARRASEVSAARQARLAAHEAAVTEAVRTYFDRTARLEAVRADAQQRAEQILTEAQQTVAGLALEAEDAVRTLRRLGEPVVEIAQMTELPVSAVRALVGKRASAPTRLPDSQQQPSA